MSSKETEISVIPDEWSLIKLGDVAEVLSGYAFKRNDFTDDGIPVIRIKNIVPPEVTLDDVVYVSKELSDVKGRYKVKYNDILISMTGSNINQIASAVGKVGRVRIKDREMLLNQRVGKIYVTDFKKYDERFLYYIVSTDEYRWRLASSAGGSANQANISPGDIKALKLPCPPLEEQKSIAKILSSLDDKIETNNQINKKLEGMAQEIYKQWFVDFEFPNEDGQPYKSSGGEMVESELGIIPSGWTTAKMGDVSDIQNGFAFKAPEYVDKGIKVLRTLNIGDNGYFENSNLVYLPSHYNNEKYNKYLFEKFDIALVMVGASIGKIGMVLENTENSFQNQNMWRFRTKRKEIPQLYINYVVREAQKISRNWSTGSARDFYRKDSFSKITVLVPNKKILHEFNLKIKPLFDEISNLTNENEKLSILRDTILPKLMSGEIRVPLVE